MEFRKTLESKLEKLDVSSLSEEQVIAMLKILVEKPINEESKPEIYKSLFNSIVDFNPYAIGITDSKGRMIKVNKAFLELFGSIPPVEISIFDDPIVKAAGFGAELERARNGEIVHIPELYYNPGIYFPELPSKGIWTKSVLFSLRNENGNISNYILIHEDITNNRKAEEKLVQSEEKYKQVFENIQVVYYETSIDGIITEISPSVEVYTKYKREELLNLNVFDIYYDNNNRERLLADISKQGRLHNYKIELRDKDGAKIYCSLNSKLVHDKSGTPVKIVGAILNITDLHNTIDALKISEERFRDIFDYSRDIIWTMDSEGNFTSLNSSGYKIFGFKSPEDTTQNIENVFIPESFKLAMSNIRNKILAEEEYTTYEIETITHEGKSLFLEISSFLKYKNGRPDEMFGIARDITIRKKQEEELNKTREKYKELFESTNDIVYTVDLEGNFTSVNSKTEKILGYTPEEFTKLNVYNCITPESAKASSENLNKKLKGEATNTVYEVDFINKDGSITILEANSAIRYKDGKPFEIFAIARNVTERKKTEEELNKTREKFKELFEGTNDIVYTMDFEGNFTSVNPMVEKMLGVKFNEIKKINMKDYLTPESAVRAFENIERKLKGEKSNTVYVVEFVNADGSYTSLEVNSMIRYRDGKPIEIFGIARDITDRLKTEEELNKTRERYMELFETSNDVIYTMDFKGTITSVNPMAQKMLGYNFEELNAPNMKDYVSPETLKLAFENIQAKLKGEKSHSVYEAEFRKNDGSFITFEINSQLRYKDGMPIEIFGIARDITDRKQALEALKRSEEKYRHITENMRDLVSVHDNRGFYKFLSSSILGILGYKPEELLGKTPMDFAHPDDIKKQTNNFRTVWHESIKASKDFKIEYRFRKKNGEYIWVEALLKPIFDRNGNIAEIHDVSRDISDRKIAEEKIQAHLKEQLLLIETASALGSIHEKNEIYDFVGNKIYELVENAYVFVVSYNDDRKSLSICHQNGLGEFIPLVGKILKMDPYEFELVLPEMDPDDLSLLKTNSLNNIPGGLYTLSGKKVKKNICKTIESMLGIKAVYAIGFSWKDGLFGGLAILSKDNKIPAKVRLVETIINQSAVALQRIFAEDSLTESEKLYRSLVDTSPDSIALTDLKGYIITANKKAFEIFGVPYDPDFNIKSKNIIDFIAPDHRERAVENYLSLINGQKFHDEVYHGLRLNGTEFPIEINSSLLYDNEQKSHSVISVIRDISKRRISEAKEKTYNQHISTLMKSATKFVEISPEVNIGEVIIEYLAQLSSAKYLMVDSYNKETNELKVEAFHADSNTHNQLTKILGGKIVGMTFKPEDYVLRELKSRDIVMVPGGLYEFAGKKIPQSVCRSIEKLFNIGNIYVLGLSMNDELFGCASIILREGEELENEDILKTYMHQVSTVLQRRKSELELKQSEEKYRMIFENAPLGIMTADVNGNIIEINPTLIHLIGSKSVAESKDINVLTFKPMIKSGFVNNFRRCLETGETIISEHSYTTRWDKYLDVRLYSTPVRNLENKVSGFQIIIEDITEEKIAEKKIKSALSEKEVLLREIHHRVKNNMQIIISLINMQVHEESDANIIRKFKELQQRVRTMSIIHEDLYLSKDLSKINFGNYLQRLANNLLQIYPHNFEIELKFDIADVYLGIDTAIPCGLIVNEILSNSFKHAYPEEWINSEKMERPRITVDFKCIGEKCLLNVSDNGIGMPCNGEVQEKNTLGLVLIEILVNQLNGSMKINNEHGTLYEIVIDKEGK